MTQMSLLVENVIVWKLTGPHAECNAIMKNDEATAFFISTTVAFSDFGGVAALFATEQDADCHELSSDRRTSMFCRSERFPLGPAQWSSGLETGRLWFSDPWLGQSKDCGNGPHCLLFGTHTVFWVGLPGGSRVLSGP